MITVDDLQGSKEEKEAFELRNVEKYKIIEHFIYFKKQIQDTFIKFQSVCST